MPLTQPDINVLKVIRTILTNFAAAITGQASTRRTVLASMLVGVDPYHHSIITNLQKLFRQQSLFKSTLNKCIRSMPGKGQKPMSFIDSLLSNMESLDKDCQASYKKLAELRNDIFLRSIGTSNASLTTKTDITSLQTTIINETRTNQTKLVSYLTAHRNDFEEHCKEKMEGIANEKNMNGKMNATGTDETDKIEKEWETTIREIITIIDRTINDVQADKHCLTAKSFYHNWTHRKRSEEIDGVAQMGLTEENS